MCGVREGRGGERGGEGRGGVGEYSISGMCGVREREREKERERERERVESGTRNYLSVDLLDDGPLTHEQATKQIIACQK